MIKTLSSCFPPCSSARQQLQPARECRGRRLTPWLAAAGLALLLAACAPAPAPPNVLIVTIDTLRPDALGFINPGKDTPAIDALAAESFAFSRAVTPVPITLPAHTSMFSGLSPHRHGVHDNGQLVAPALPLLAERLQSAGFRTGAFVSGFPLQAMFGLDRGFDHYDDKMPDGEQGWVERRAEGTTVAAQAWIEQEDDSPFLAWVHYYDPHDPYEPPREFWQPGARGSYDGEVTYVDYWLEKLITTARQRSGERELLVVLTADHGEALGEHGEITHGYFIYDSTVLVPLIFHWDGRIVTRTSEQPARLVDLAPTVLELLGLEPLQDVDGISFAELLTGARADMQMPGALVETWLPWTYYGWAPLTALREPEYKYIDAPTPELYDLQADPGEARNLASDQADRAEQLAVALSLEMAQPAAVSSTSTDEAAIAKLRSLGYVGVGAEVQAPPRDLPDPKDQLELRGRLQQGEDMLRGGRFLDARAIFEQALEEQPDNLYALLRSGIASLQAGQPAAAVAPLQRAIVIEPRRAEARYALGDSLARIGRHEEAAEQWAALVELQPRRPEAWFNLAFSLRAAGRREDALAAVDMFLQLEPDSAEGQRLRAAVVGSPAEPAPSAGLR